MWLRPCKQMFLGIFHENMIVIFLGTYLFLQQQLPAPEEEPQFNRTSHSQRTTQREKNHHRNISCSANNRQRIAYIRFGSSASGASVIQVPVAQSGRATRHSRGNGLPCRQLRFTFFQQIDNWIFLHCYKAFACKRDAELYRLQVQRRFFGWTDCEVIE